MNDQPGILIGKGKTPQSLLLKYANRHGLIAGATGTGKTVSLQVLAEGFSSQGVPVFMADIKSDLSGVSMPGNLTPKLQDRAKKLGVKNYRAQGFPTVFWDLFGQQGHPLRTTISDMGPLLLSRLLELNDTQEGVLNITFKLADDQGLLLLDLKDLRSMITFVGEHSKELSTTYGNITTPTVGAIQRRLLVLEQQGGANLLGEPALDLRDFMRADSNGYGYVNVLMADKLMENPRLYATFMLWLMSELFEELPEVGDVDKPKLVFFFDEAHLLFQDAPAALLEKIEQVVRLIRSKGVGIYFISQNPLDIPEKVLAQLGNRLQHALRAFTPKDQKAVRVAAETFRPNPAFDAARAITELSVGEALVSTLEEEAVPGVVERVLVRPPASRIGPITAEERRAIIQRSPLLGKYDQLVDRESAYEKLTARATKVEPAPSRAGEPPQQPADEGSGWGLPDILTGTRKRQGVLEAMAKSAARTIGSTIGREIIRGVLGSILKGK
jgi:DNA helicase HerA-like ATPase